VCVCVCVCFMPACVYLMRVCAYCVVSYRNRPVGCMYVSGGYNTSFSFGNSESQHRSAPRCSELLVTILKMSDSVLSP
jgi:hypothetical protein